MEVGDAIVLSSFMREALESRSRTFAHALAIKTYWGELPDGPEHTQDKIERLAATALVVLPKEQLEREVSVIGQALDMLDAAVPKPADHITAIMTSSLAFLGKMRSRSLQDARRFVENIDRDTSYLVMCSRPLEARLTFHLDADVREHVGLNIRTA